MIRTLMTAIATQSVKGREFVAGFVLDKDVIATVERKDGLTGVPVNMSLITDAVASFRPRFPRLNMFSMVARRE